MLLLLSKNKARILAQLQIHKPRKGHEQNNNNIFFYLSSQYYKLESGMTEYNSSDSLVCNIKSSPNKLGRQANHLAKNYTDTITIV